MKLTKKEAYKIMYIFLDDLYIKTKLDDIGVLLGGFSILIDGCTADPAAWLDWEQVVQEKTLNNLLDINQVILIINNFFKYHKDNFDFDLDMAITEFNKLSSNKEQFEIYVQNILADPQSDERIKLTFPPNDN